MWRIVTDMDKAASGVDATAMALSKLGSSKLE
jgi:hypothetical protein